MVKECILLISMYTLYRLHRAHLTALLLFWNHFPTVAYTTIYN